MVSARYDRRKGRRHKTVTDYAQQMLVCLRRWLPDRDLVVVADGGYAKREFWTWQKNQPERPQRVKARSRRPRPALVKGTCRHGSERFEELRAHLGVETRLNNIGLGRVRSSSVITDAKQCVNLRSVALRKQQGNK